VSTQYVMTDCIDSDFKADVKKRCYTTVFVEVYIHVMLWSGCSTFNPFYRPDSKSQVIDLL